MYWTFTVKSYRWCQTIVLMQSVQNAYESIYGALRGFQQVHFLDYFPSCTIISIPPFPQLATFKALLGWSLQGWCSTINESLSALSTWLSKPHTRCLLSLTYKTPWNQLFYTNYSVHCLRVGLYILTILLLSFIVYEHKFDYIIILPFI